MVEVKEKSWQIPIQWLLKFLIEATNLESAMTDNNPFSMVKLEKLFEDEIKPYQIQVNAWVVIDKGHSLLLCSGTGTGKTEAVFFGILETLLKDENACCLILYPLKALAQDQEGRLRGFCVNTNLAIQRYDSSISKKAKRKIRNNPGKIIIITPDTLIESIIATHIEGWWCANKF